MGLVSTMESASRTISPVPDIAAAQPPPPPPPPRPPPPAAQPLVVAPAGSRLPTPTVVATGPATLGSLTRRTVLYYWPGDGWVRGTVVRRNRAQGLSHVVRYGPRSALGAAIVGSLLDAASHGPAGHWVLLCPTRY